MLPKSFGTGLALTSTNSEIPGAPVFQFNNLGNENGKMANFLIQDMMEGQINKAKQK